MAILSAVSAASEPELVKKTWSRSAGASSARREERLNAIGCANWKVGEKSSSAACLWIAATIGPRLWPALQHQSAAVASKISRPSGVKLGMSARVDAAAGAAALVIYGLLKRRAKAS